MMRTYNIVFLFLCIVFMGSCENALGHHVVDKLLPIVHHAHLSDGWYPQQKAELLRVMGGFFSEARKHFSVVADASKIRALLVPHAGFNYSGLCAATAYQSIVPVGAAKNSLFRKVIVLCPSHTTFLKGCALPKFNQYKTILGDIDIDAAAIEKLKKDRVFNGDSRAFDTEHAIEIQLPFLQYTLNNFKLIPIIVGHLSDENIADVLQGLSLVIDRETLVIVSTDFVHHGDRYEYDIFDRNILDNVRHFDARAVNAVCAQDYKGFEAFLKETKATICGQDPIKLLLGLVNKRVIDGVNARLSCYYTSAHMTKARPRAGDFSASALLKNVDDAECHESVSYVSLIFTTQNYKELRKEDVLTGYEKKALLAFARRVIENAFIDKRDQVSELLLYPIMSFGMQQQNGAFVTLKTKRDELRGCIGAIVAQDSLFKTVARMAMAAAFNDTRFHSLKKQELNDIVLSISVLTEPVDVASYQDIQIGKHGIILNKVDAAMRLTASAVYLPQVPIEQHWSRETTLEFLSEKAGLPRDAWRESCRYQVFEGYEIKEL